jgi:calmodulin
MGILDPTVYGINALAEFIKMMAIEAKPGNFELEMRSAFKVFDKDGSGTISPEEMAQVMQSLGEKLSDEELEFMIKEVDKDGNGSIDCTYFF